MSIIIPAKDAVATLPATLSSVSRQDYSNIEVIVCDGGSLDDTRLVAQGAGARVIEGGPERSRQCNAAAAVARGSYLYRVDADFTLHPAVVTEAVFSCERLGFDAVAVPNTGAGVMYWERVRRLERDCYRGDRTIVAVRFMRTDVFHTVGGFDEDLVAGEDYDLHNRVVGAGYRWHEIEHGEEHWGEPKSLREAARKSYYYGKSIRRYLRKHPARGARQVNPFRSGFWRHRRQLSRQPELLGGLVLLKATQYASGAAGMVAAVLQRSAQ